MNPVVIAQPGHYLGDGHHHQLLHIHNPYGMANHQMQDQNLQNLNFLSKVKDDFHKVESKVKPVYEKAKPYLKTAGKVAIAAGQACLAVDCEAALLAAALNMQSAPVYLI